MKLFFTCLNLAICFVAFSQDKKTEQKTSAIVEEGKQLYRSEMASWYGSDIFMEKFSDKKTILGGYLSYTEDNISKCIFFSKAEEPKVILTVSFDSTYAIHAAKTDATERALTANEYDLYVIRKLALTEINSDTLFKTYKNTNLNLIPLIDKGAKKVYVLTGPQNNGVVIFGNDYLLSFDNKNKLTHKKQLHRNIIPINYSEETHDAIAMHSHLPETGDLMTPTDVCTTLLYEKFADWKQHIVVSEEFICIWDCKTDQLTTMSKKVWDKIAKDQEKRHGK